MRTIACGCLFLLASVSWAQPAAQRRATPSMFLIGAIDRMEGDLRASASALRRDAFILSQLVAATGEIDDFQRAVALEKARDRVETALKRAMDRPPAPPATIELLQSEKDLLDKARQQGAATADIRALKHELLARTHALQQTMFTELDDLRRERQALTDAQSRLSSITNDIDNSVGEALASTLDYFRAGGR